MNSELIIDGRELAPPGPLERVLQALHVRGPEQRVRLLVPVCPYPLYDLLDQRNYPHTTRQLDDGSFEVIIEPTSAADAGADEAADRRGHG